MYCCVNSKDGLFDIKIYDVTEIDATSSKEFSKFKGPTPENISRRKVTTNVQPLLHQSILMVLLALEPVVAFEFILLPPIGRVINQKWNAYRKYFYPWLIFHFIFMLLLTCYCVIRSEQSPNTPTGYDVNTPPMFTNKFGKEAFVTVCGIICCVVSILYIGQDIRRKVMGHMPCYFKAFLNPYGNGLFRVMFDLLGSCLIIDVFLSILNTYYDNYLLIPGIYYENYLLIPAMIIGWFLTLFFIRAIRQFSFFTVLIQKILTGDMPHFFVILSIEIIAFATAMHMAIQGSGAVMDKNYSNIWRVIVSMFNLMVGVGDLAELYDTRHPGLCIVIFVGFVIMTSLLMINALIAMMSRTCMELVENVGNIRIRDRHWKLQRLSIILFLESILPNSFIFKVGTKEDVMGYSNDIHGWIMMKRYKLEIRSLQNNDENDDADGAISTRWGFRTAVVNAFYNNPDTLGETRFSGISGIVRQIAKGNDKTKKKTDDSSMHNHNTEVKKQSPVQVQVQPPQTYSKPELDIYHISRCRNCSISGIEHNV